MPEEKVELDFESLEAEGSGQQPGKFAEFLKLLKTKLGDEEYTTLVDKLGLGADLSNKELLAKLEQILKPEVKEESKEDVEAADPDYKTFIADCMKGGKDLKTCTDEYKAKGTPQDKPADAPPAAPAAASALELKVKELENQLAQLTKSKELAEIEVKVDGLIQEKHLAPAQRAAVVKLSAQLDSATRDGLLNVFKTQKFNFNKDVGKIETPKPAVDAKAARSPERTTELMKTFHIDELIDDKGVKKPRRDN